MLSSVWSRNMEGRGPPLEPLLAPASPRMFTCYLFTFTRNSSINPNYLSWVLGFLHSYFYIVTFFTCFLFCFFQIPGASLSPKLSAFQTLSHTELSDNSSQPSGTIMVLKSVEIDPVDPGMKYFSFSSPFLRSRAGGGCFPSPSCDLLPWLPSELLMRQDIKLVISLCPSTFLRFLYFAPLSTIWTLGTG